MQWKDMVAMMLYILETMQWFLKTAFGQSETSFEGTRWDLSMGLGQGNGVAPPGLLTVSSLMINAHCRQRHGTELVGAWVRDKYNLEEP